VSGVTYLVGDKIDFSLDLTHSLNDAGVGLDHIAEGLGRANLERDVLGGRSVRNLEVAHVLPRDEGDHLGRVQCHELAYICC